MKTKIEKFVFGYIIECQGGLSTKNFSPLYFDIEQQRYILYKYARKELFPIHDLDNMRA